MPLKSSPWRAIEVEVGAAAWAGGTATGTATVAHSAHSTAVLDTAPRVIGNTVPHFRAPGAGSTWLWPGATVAPRARPIACGP